MRNVRLDTSGNAVFKLSRDNAPLKIYLRERRLRLKDLDISLVPDADLKITAYLADQGGGPRMNGINLDQPLKFKIVALTEDALHLSREGNKSYTYSFYKR